ncbi:hypothetical protein NDU88_003512 [Pleurodeles waltl]|uniref:Uncharacterized protein n=1 Tax=Pleurodeles waltl TaxID=8319 RepID=A0AAV7M3L1_PLEWA|nr:hypothetical protein NDU88_003512 [Pleurodeles waltl]
MITQRTCIEGPKSRSKHSRARKAAADQRDYRLQAIPPAGQRKNRCRTSRAASREADQKGDSDFQNAALKPRGRGLKHRALIALPDIPREADQEGIGVPELCIEAQLY